jgi:hypothetical protein
MEVVAVARVLWRVRILVAVGLVLAGGLGYKLMKGPTTRAGVASTRVMLDTPTSQTVEANSVFGPSLAWRGGLVGDLMSSDAVRQRIARAMGIPLKSLVIQAPYMATPPIDAQLPKRALDAAAVIPEPYELAIQAVTPLPIVAIDARAPRPAEAVKLAGIAAREVKTFATEPTTPGGQFVVEQISPVRAKEVINGPRKVMTVGVAMLFFGMWCAGITLIAGLRHRRRVISAQSRATFGHPAAGLRS